MNPQAEVPIKTGPEPQTPRCRTKRPALAAVSMVALVVIVMAVGALGYYLMRESPPWSRSAKEPRMIHSSSDRARIGMEEAFARQYLKFHKGADLEGLLGMGKFEGVWDNIMASKKRNLTSTFQQEIIGFTFRELEEWEIWKYTDLSLQPVLGYKISFAQPNPAVDLIGSYSGFLGVQKGQLYMVDRVKQAAESGAERSSQNPQ